MRLTGFKFSRSSFLAILQSGVRLVFFQTSEFSPEHHDLPRTAKSCLAMTLASSVSICECIPSGPTKFCTSCLFQCSLTWSFLTNSKSSLLQTPHWSLSSCIFIIYVCVESGAPCLSLEASCHLYLISCSWGWTSLELGEGNPWRSIRCPWPFFSPGSHPRQVFKKINFLITWLTAVQDTSADSMLKEITDT